jgi:quercetin dioxygenase-like cupin family protein
LDGVVTMEVRNAAAIDRELRHASTLSVAALIAKGEMVEATQGSFLRGVSEFALADGGSMAPHQHPWDEFYYLLRGTAYMQIGGEAQLLGRGDFVRIPPGLPHTIGSAVSWGYAELPLVLAFSLSRPGDPAEAEPCELAPVTPLDLIADRRAG